MEDDLSSEDEDLTLKMPNIFANAAATTILTPRKAVRPSTDTLSPLTLLTSNNNPGNSCNSSRASPVRSKLSMNFLLTEKRKDDVVRENVDSIRELKENIGDDDFMKWVTDHNDDSILNCSQMSNSQDFDDSQDTHTHREKGGLPETGKEAHKDALTASQEKFLPDATTRHMINDFLDTYPGEKMFTQYQCPDDMTLDFKELYTYLMGLESPELETDLNLDNEDFQLLMLQSISDLHPNSLPSDICNSLWHVVIGCQDSKLSHASFKILLDYLFKSVIEWTPHVDDFITLLQTCGGDLDMILPHEVCQLLSRNKIEENDISLNDCPISPKSIRKCFNSRLHNFSGGIRLMTIAIQHHKQKYSVSDINCMVVLACRLSIEKIIQTVICELKLLIGSLVDFYEDAVWKVEIAQIWRTLGMYEMHHRNLLKMVETIPPTSSRGVELKQFLAFNAASLILQKPASTLVYRSLPIRITDVLKLISQVQIKEDTVYFELYSVFRLLFLCVDTDNVSATQRTNLSNLTDRFQMIHGEIKECQGAFMDRTKVKDVLLRIVYKLKGVINSLQSQPKMDHFFGSQNSFQESNSEESQSQ